MTVRLRLSGAIVDVPDVDHDHTVTFWAGALGKPPVVTEKFPDYAQFDEVTPGLYFMVQTAGDDTRRVHLDFESEDIDAEVARLTGLGATEVERHHHWVVMRDPTGVIFCVVARDPSTVTS
jgi:Glyoxalase-like domain